MRNRSFRLLCLTTLAGALAWPAAAQTWSGPYGGVHIGAAKPAEKSDERLIFDTNQDGNYGDTVNTAAPANAFSPGFCDGSPRGNNAGAGCNDDGDGYDIGLRAGYDWQAGNIVYGLLGEWSAVDIEDSVTGFSTTPAAYHFKRSPDVVSALRGRLGYGTDNWLAYGTAGVAWTRMDRDFRTTNAANSFTPRGGDDENAMGYQAGLGLERRMNDAWSLGVEYLYTSFEDEDYTVRVGPGTAPASNPFLIVNATGTDMRRDEDKFDYHSVRLVANFRFGQ
ncbi:outer membrane protein [Asticcacaulis sp. AND118]|uniref:outer membrane protein n=1 Tax=Asticcacaulis sp. AND118 TaxID=2840468 RepID=UPI001CFF82EF|nr:outer membrane beta-barrel protein [Asticcacaulis sp. AND118]UDF04549.1 outer membrane beta-barrel protein [Asticcacaulis sp. AND118]